MTGTMIAASLDAIPPAQQGKPALWSDADLAAFVNLLGEQPALVSPKHYRARSTARGHAERLRALLAVRGVNVSVRVWREAEGTKVGRFRWAVIRQQESEQ
jgi:hypothetical protein